MRGRPTVYIFLVFTTRPRHSSVSGSGYQCLMGDAVQMGSTILQCTMSYNIYAVR